MLQLTNGAGINGQTVVARGPSVIPLLFRKEDNGYPLFWMRTCGTMTWDWPEAIPEYWMGTKMFVAV